MGSAQDLLLSAETKGLAKASTTDPWGTPARWGVETFPGAVAWLKERIRPDEAFVYRPNPPSPEPTRFTVDPIGARVSTEKAQRMIGFRALIAREQAMELTLHWARYARVVPHTARAEMAAR
jgi:hypothetical protein